MAHLRTLGTVIWRQLLFGHWPVPGKLSMPLVGMGRWMVAECHKHRSLRLETVGLQWFGSTCFVLQSNHCRYHWKHIAREPEHIGCCMCWCKRNIEI